MALSGPLFVARGVLVSANDRAVDQLQRLWRVGCQGLEHAQPDALLGPTIEAAILLALRSRQQRGEDQSFAIRQIEQRLQSLHLEV